MLPLDGNIDASLRQKLNAEVVRLAKTLPGTVNIADTTFEETAAAVGCEATAPTCGETVRSTLGVDEIVYGRATTDGSRTDLVVYRVRIKTAPHSARASLESDDAESAEPALRELFDAKSPTHQAPPPAKEPPQTAAVPVEDNASPPPPPAEGGSHPRRTRGIIITAAGGGALAVGVGLWLSAHGDQGDIDAANPQTADDFRALHSKEDRAQRNAIFGDVLVGVGAGLATWGIITIVRSHAESNVVIAPSVSSSTAGVILEGSW
ncbi:MAG TPA: hypothetical protein VGM90_21140 [Kofleriaceae bacterium]